MDRYDVSNILASVIDNDALRRGHLGSCFEMRHVISLALNHKSMWCAGQLSIAAVDAVMACWERLRSREHCVASTVFSLVRAGTKHTLPIICCCMSSAGKHPAPACPHDLHTPDRLSIKCKGKSLT